MEAFLVGGAVRDQLLGLPVKDRDWLVLGASPNTLKQQGFQQVGRDFPIFLHPKTREEYALPRGGESSQSIAVQIESDLIRRDLTINAMARTEDGRVIDPLNGQKDIERRLLRHTPFFHQDPIRVLRLARFAARYLNQGFRIADETKTLVLEMKLTGKLNHLVGERVWAEIEQSLLADYAVSFFQSLRELKVLDIFLSPLDRLFGVPQPEKHHPEVDTGVHSLMVLQQACDLSPCSHVRLAALLHDTGKGLTPKALLPRHLGHEQAGLDRLRSLSHQLKLPKACKKLLLRSAEYHTLAHRAFELTAKRLLKLILSLDGLRQPHCWHDFILVCEADSRGRQGFESRDYPQATYLRGALVALTQLDTSSLVQSVTDARRIPDVIHKARLACLKGYIRDQGPGRKNP